MRQHITWHWHQWFIGVGWADPEIRQWAHYKWRVYLFIGPLTLSIWRFSDEGSDPQDPPSH
jgi:hypothetical protein